MPGNQEKVFAELGELMMDTDEQTDAYIVMNE